MICSNSKEIQNKQKLIYHWYDSIDYLLNWYDLVKSMRITWFEQEYCYDTNIYDIELNGQMIALEWIVQQNKMEK